MVGVYLYGSSARALSPLPHHAVLIYLFITEEPRLALNSLHLSQPLECGNAGTHRHSQLCRDVLCPYFHVGNPMGEQSLGARLSPAFLSTSQEASGGVDDSRRVAG